MPRYKFLFIAACLCFPLFYSCKTKQKEVPIKTARFFNLGELGPHYDIEFPKDSVERDVPDIYRDNVLYREKQKIDSVLNIGTIENGYAGQQIRISGNEYNEFKNGWTRFILLTHQGSWSATVYYLRFASQDGFTPTIDSLQYQEQSLGEPKSGWTIFTDSLKQKGLFEFRDYALVPGYGASLNTDEVVYDVEIASPKKYRIFGYPGPKQRVEKFAEARKFMEIIDFIKKEFVFPEPYSPSQPLVP